jgi:RimJ/RimL family protein N-acetyltransferase
MAFDEKLVVDLTLVEVRNFCEQDVEGLVKYWYHSPSGYIEILGIDPGKLLPEQEFQAWLIGECRANSQLEASKSHLLTITYNGAAIGNHAISPLIEGDYGVFHAHIWSPEMRGKGVARVTYPRACLIFVDRFNLKRILFKTPIQNIAAIRAKEQLGIRCIGEEIIDFGIVKDGTRAKVFELTKPETEKLISRP